MLVEPDEIAPLMKHAIVAIEDRRFYEHQGVDIRGIARAAWEDITNKRVVQGGSTITQQFVKNAIVRDDRTISRKVKEAALAWQLEQRWRQGRDPDRVPEHDLLRQRRLRHPAGGAHVLRTRRLAADASRGGAAGRDSGRPVPLRPGGEPRRRRVRRDLVLRDCSSRARSRAATCSRRPRRRSRRPDDVRLPR